MLFNDNVLMSVGHLDHVLLTVYSSMEHVTWNSPGRQFGLKIKEHKKKVDSFTVGTQT